MLQEVTDELSLCAGGERGHFVHFPASTNILAVFKRFSYGTHGKDQWDMSVVRRKATLLISAMRNSDLEHALIIDVRTATHGTPLRFPE